MFFLYIFMCAFIGVVIVSLGSVFSCVRFCSLSYGPFSTSRNSLALFSWYFLGGCLYFVSQSSFGLVLGVSHLFIGINK